jgi:hypothetical protein
MPITKASSNAVAPAAKGDLVVGNATNDSGVLAVGSTDQVLTVDSSTATGLKWATVSAGPGNLVQIATGTLSGTSVTLSSLSGYSELLLVMYGITNATASTTYGVRVNNNSGSNYKLIGASAPNGIEQVFLDTAGSSFYHHRDTNNTTNNTFAIKFTNTKTAGFTDVDYYGFVYGDNGQPYNTVYKGIYTVSEVVSSLVIMNYGSRNFTAGTYILYGA